MADVKLRTEVKPRGKICFPQLLYTQPGYLRLQGNTDVLHFWAEQNESIVVHMAFHFEGITAISLQKAPFGGLMSAATLSSQTLSTWWTQAEEELAKKGAKEIIIHQPPHIYGDDHAGFYTTAGFKKYRDRLYHAIAISPKKSWLEQASTMEKRKWKKCEKVGAKWVEVKGAERMNLVEKLLFWRSSDEKPASLRIADIENAMVELPKHYHVFGVKLNGEWVAATLAVLASEMVLYHFIPASHPDYKTYSPMVFLVEGLYRKAQEWQLNWIDLGASEVLGQPKSSLIHFKEQIGGKPCHAYSWKKSVNWQGIRDL